MDPSILYKSNVVGNTVMRKNRAVKANVERNTKRKELFSQGRDIKLTPEPQPQEKSTLKQPKKSEKLAKKVDAYRARFKEYMEEKKNRLAKEKNNKKPPFISAVNPKSTSSVKKEAKKIEFRKPSNITSKKTANKQKAKLNIDLVQNKKWLNVENAETSARSKSQEISHTKVSKKFNSKSIHLNALKLPSEEEAVDGQTPHVTDKVFVFNGATVTSTVRKQSLDQPNKMVGCFEEILSPIEGISPLETSVGTAIEPEGDIDLNKTPPAQNKMEQEHFYVSPFVTTSRGKVSANKERKNRDSVYKLELNNSNDEPLDVRRCRETVKYFRKVLSDEIERLHGLCKTWELYQLENVMESYENCTDMINVAVGQAKLLTGGKLKQFQQLIDDCESSTYSADAREIVPKILPEDIEGYWSAIKLQIDNIDCRFQNLILWKDNFWVDPYEKPKPKERLKPKEKLLAKSLKNRKVKRKINPVAEVKSLIIKAHKQYLENKANNIEGNQDIIFTTRRLHVKENDPLTPSKTNNIAPIRRIKTPFRIPLQSKENRTPTLNTPSFRRISLLKDMKSSSQYNRRLSETPKSSSARKSILRSEAKKSKKKSVLFSEQIQFKSPDSFRIRNSFSELYGDESHRSLQLRTRKVLMRKNELSD